MASSVAGQPDDVWVCGFQVDPVSAVHKAMLWKNGAAQPLTGVDGTTPSEAWDVKLAGGVPYLTGFINNGSNNVAQIWAGSSLIPLVAGIPWDTQGNAVFVAGSNVYAIGNRATALGATPADTVYQAMTWEAPLNPDLSLASAGVASTVLTAPGHQASGNDIKVANGVVYASGWEADGLVPARHLAKLWVDGSPSPSDLAYTSPQFPNPANATEAYGASVVGTDVYVSGFLNDGTLSHAVLWHNNALVALGGAPSSAGSNVFAMAN